MRWVSLACLLGGIALADPPSLVRDAQGAPRATWADWVGDWQGRLRWSGCTIDGEPAASIAVDAADGQVAIDLSGAGGALGTVPLVADDASWTGRAGDVSVRIARDAQALAVAVTLDSGCAMHASLRRASVDIPACDSLVAWARIESRCTKLTKPPLENMARVAHQRIAWSQASELGAMWGRGPITIEQGAQFAAQCSSRAAKVEAELAAVGCVPAVPPPPPPAFPACTQLRAAAAKVARCGAIPFDVATSLAHDANALADATAGIESASSHDAIEKQCSAKRADLVQSAPGCF